MKKQVTGLSHKIRKCTALLLVLCVSAAVVSSCNSKQVIPSSPRGVPYAIPEKLSSGRVGQFDAVFCYATKSDIPEFVMLEQTVEMQYGQSVPNRIMQTLFEGITSDRYRSLVAENLTYERTELSGTVASVYSSQTGDVSIDKLIETEFAIIRTLNSFFDVTALSLFVNGRPLEYMGLPLGYCSYVDGPLKEAVEQRLEPYKLGTSEIYGGIPITTNFVAYTTDESGYVFASPQTLSFKRESDVAAQTDIVIERLRSMNSVDDTWVAVPPCVLIANGDETFGVDVDFSQFSDYVNKDLLNAAVVLSITGYVPNVSSVNVSFADGNAYPSTRTECSEYIGWKLSMFFPVDDGAELFAHDVDIRFNEANDIARVLQCMFDTAKDIGADFPVLTNAINDAYIENGVVIVNFNSGVMKTLTSFVSGGGEQLVIYAMVNSLASFPTVKSVLFVEEGRNLGMLGSIYLGYPLLKNPGIIPA